MNEIINKTYELIDAIDSSDIIKEIDVYKKKILNNSKLCDLIEKGNNADDEYLIRDIKKQLYGNSDYKGYIDNYNKLFYIVMKINSKFKKYTDGRKCYRI